MSSEQYTKGEIVINPMTKRPIKVGSRIWNGLVKQGVFKQHIDDNVLADISEEDSDEMVDQLISKISKKLPKHTQAVKGRGKYKNQIVKRSKPQQNIKETAKIVSRTIQNPKLMRKLQKGGNFQDIVESMILNELNPKNQKQKKKNVSFQSDSESDDDSDYAPPQQTETDTSQSSESESQDENVWE